MGLRIWLPLNGNLENKGLGEINNIQGTPSYRANGKIGSALELNTKITISSSQLANLSTFTLCFWVNVNSSTSLTTNWADIIGFTNINSTGTQGWFRCETCYNLTNWEGAHWHDNNVNAMLGSKISGTEIHTKNDDIWCHCVLVCNNKISKISFYTNGELTGEFVHNGGTINNTGTFYIGDTGNITGIINDIRIYDEALSPMQIKLISQGLVAHYLLNNNGIPNNPNLLKKQIKESAWSLWGYGDATREKVTIGNKVWAHVIQNNTTRYDGYSINPDNNGIIIDQNHQYIISFMAKRGNSQPNSEIIVWWHWRSTEGGANIAQNFIRVNISDDTPHRYSCVISKCTDTTYDVNRINIMMGSYKANNEIYFTDVKFEEGDVATPWIPNEEDAEYTALGFNDNTEYDVSGYCHNGTKYNITDYTSDTPRYSVATKFNGTNSYINIGRGGMVRDEITVNIWGYMDDWTTYNYRFISCTESGGWNFEKSSDGIHFAIGTGATSNSYKNTTNYPLANLTSGWHMFTGSYDGFQNKMYIDGVLAAQNNSPYTTKTPIYYNSSAPVLIGAEANKTQSPAGYYFNGYMSDVRIYATALSESDLQSLYNNSGFLDSSGNIYATEYTES